MPDSNRYETGIKVTDEEMEKLNIIRNEFQVVSLSCLDELDLSVETGVLFQVTGQKIEPAPYMKEVQ